MIGGAACDRGFGLGNTVGYCEESIGDVVRHFKQAGISALEELGITGRMWTRGYDKRFCFNNKELDARVKYVLGHNK